MIVALPTVANFHTVMHSRYAFIFCKYVVDIVSFFVKGAGGGGGFIDFFCEICFRDIAVAQQTMARDRTFEGVVVTDSCHSTIVAL